MALCNDVCNCTGNGMLAIQKCHERVLITLAYFFHLLLMAVQQTFLRAVACLPVGPQHRTVRSYPRALRARPYRSLYFPICTEFKSHYGKVLRCSLCGMPCSVPPGKIGLPFSINTVSNTNQNYKS